MAKMWVPEFRNPWTDCHKIWQGWLYAGGITHSTKILNDRFNEAYQQQVKQYCRVIFSLGHTLLLWPCVCPSFCPSFRPSQAGVPLKWLSISSRSQHHMIA